MKPLDYRSEETKTEYEYFLKLKKEKREKLIDEMLNWYIKNVKKDFEK